MSPTSAYTPSLPGAGQAGVLVGSPLRVWTLSPAKSLAPAGLSQHGLVAIEGIKNGALRIEMSGENSVPKRGRSCLQTRSSGGSLSLHFTSVKWRIGILGRFM